MYFRGSDFCYFSSLPQLRWETWQPASTLHELKLVGLFPIDSAEDTRHKFIAPGNVPAYFMAVDAVNKNKSILSDFRIHPIVLNGACEPAMVMRQFIEILRKSSSLGFYNNMVNMFG